MRSRACAPNSHSGKALRHILETLPRDELFQSSGEELFAHRTGILGLQERVRSKLFLRRDRYGRFFSGAGLHPARPLQHRRAPAHRGACSSETLHGEHVDTNVQLGESPLAQLHLVDPAEAGRRGRGRQRRASKPSWRRSSATGRTTCASSWSRATARSRACTLANRYRPRAAGRLHRGGRRRPSPRRTSTSLAALTGPDDLRLSLYRTRKGEGGLRFKFYRQHDDIPLSDALPMMENMGLRVISEHPYRARASTARSLYIQDFEVETTRREARRRQSRRELRGRLRADLARRCRERRLQPPDPRRRPVVAPGRDAARLLQVPAADRRAVLAELRRSHLRALSAAGAPAGRSVRGAVRPGTGSESKAEIKAGMERFAPAADRARPAATPHCWRRSQPVVDAAHRQARARRSRPPATRVQVAAGPRVRASTRTASCAASSA